VKLVWTLLVLAAAAMSLAQQQQQQPPKTLAVAVQPVPYSHKLHLGLGLQCKMCHTNPDPGEMMGLPEVKTCLTCHATVKADSPHIQKLTGYAKQGRPVPWVRVYQIPSWVWFSHKAHGEAGATCETCHGPVKDRDVIRVESNISMGGCMDCHDKNRASNDCAFCHPPR